MQHETIDFDNTKLLHQTFFVTSWGHNNMLFAFCIKKSVEQKEVEEPDYDDVNL